MTRIQTGDGRVHFAACTHINNTKRGPLNAAYAMWLGQKAEIATTGGRGFEGLESIIKADGCEIGIYTKTAQTSTPTLPEVEYSHKVGGARRYLERWHVYLTQPDSPWRDRHLAELRRLPAWVDDVFSDSAGLYSYQPSRETGKPAKPPGHTREYSESEWLTLVGENLSYWMDATGKRFLINGLQPATIDLYRPTVGMVEGAFGTNRGVMPTQAKWEDTARFVLEAQRKGWTPWVLAKLAGGAAEDPQRRDAWRRLLAPSMLLLDSGSLLFDLCGMEGSDPPWVTREYDHLSYQPGIGLPKITSYDLAAYGTDYPGVYRRPYAMGAVWVNATTSPVTIPLGRVIPPQSGRVYKRKPRSRV